MNSELVKELGYAIFKYSCTHSLFTAEVRNMVKDLQKVGMTYKQIIDFLLCDTE